MDDTQNVGIVAPSLPKGGGAIQSIGKGWGAVGVTGAASLSISLPITAGRGFAPQLGLGYSSASGRSEFGQGWAMGVPAIARQSTHGVPEFEPDSNGKIAEPIYVMPDGDVLLPERNKQGNIVRRPVNQFRGQALSSFSVTRYTPRVEGSFNIIEHFEGDGSSFWLIQGGDGAVHIYGYGEAARLQYTHSGTAWVAEWRLEESVAPNGEHVLYEYVSENDVGLDALKPSDSSAWLGRDCSTHGYLHRVRYGNLEGDLIPYVFQHALPLTWLFDLVLDYGECDITLEGLPQYPQSIGKTWPLRIDPISSYRYGFEVRTLRVCRQVLMFHWCIEDPSDPFSQIIANTPTLVQRLLLEYNEKATVTLLTAAHHIGYTEKQPQFTPPLEFDYSDFDLPVDSTQFKPFFSAMTGELQLSQTSAGAATGSSYANPGVDSGNYQLVDLFGEGLAGILSRYQNAWYYRRPIRHANSALGANAVDYAPWEQLKQIPTSNLRSPIRQTLIDLNGDGKLDWLVAQPGMAGFFTLNPDKQWSHYTPFAAFPTEFFRPQAQLADLMGDGLSDLALIGTRSVRLYGNLKDEGFASPIEVRREKSESNLPVLGDGRSDVVAFSDLLGTGQQHLVYIREDEVKCFPNLGRGRFGESVNFGKLAFAGVFNPANIRLADLDGSGAADILYFQSDFIQVFMNRSGHGFSDPVIIKFPSELRYDSLVDVSVADLQGLGCSSLVITTHTGRENLQPHHWRVDFVKDQKPFLLYMTDNNMGAEGKVLYRSSAQEWLDEKALLEDPESAASELPFPVHVVSEQRQLDQITGNELFQKFTYRQGYYDGIAREFRGFGLLLQTDAEQSAQGDSLEFGYTAPVQTKTWYHTGKSLHMVPLGQWSADETLVPLGTTLCTKLDLGVESAYGDWDPDTLYDAARSLSGSVLRTETLGLDDNVTPYSVSESRYGVRLLQGRGAFEKYSIMLPLALEQRTLNYERQADDPLCQHTLSLLIDRNGVVTHGTTVAYARRASAKAPFPENEEYAHLNRWWNDAKDDAQNVFYISESRSTSIEYQQGDYYRLGLPYRSQGFSYAVPAGDPSVDLTLITIEAFNGENSPLGKVSTNGEMMLSGQSRIQYQGCQDGAVNFAALVEYTETAVLDERALEAYVVKNDKGEQINLLGKTHDDVVKKLTEAGYVDVGLWNPVESTVNAAIALWATRTGYSTFADVEHFHLLLTQRLVDGVKPSRIEYDKCWLLPCKFTAPDDCVTEVTYDYSVMQPKWIRDPNQNVSEAKYDAFGRVVLSTFWGTEWDMQTDREVDVGFDRLDSHSWSFGTTPEQAIKDASILGNMATASFYDQFSWMGQAPKNLLPTGVAFGVLMPTGHLRASARRQFSATGYAHNHILDEMGSTLLELPREPVHSAVLQADRYPGDPQKQIRMTVSASDGFGRQLQSKQLVPPGKAYAVEDGSLVNDGGKPKEVDAAMRWAVSARVEYNNKGLAVRVYRPYFAETYKHINDESFRQFGYCDRQFYDPLGRPTLTFTPSEKVTRRRGAKEVRTITEYFKRVSYHAWYTVSEDENDTAHELLEAYGQQRDLAKRTLH